MEEWRDIKGHDGHYQVSDCGNVRSMDRDRHFNYPANKGGHFRKTKGVLLVPIVTRKGYHRINLYINKVGCQYSIHRLVLQAFIPNPENKPEANHKNGIKTDNRIENLEWVTSSENTIHSYKNGLQLPSRGEKAGGVKLNSFQVRVIRKCPDLTQRDLAKIFNIVQVQIHRIINRTRWNHIP